MHMVSLTHPGNHLRFGYSPLDRGKSCRADEIRALPVIGHPALKRILPSRLTQKVEVMAVGPVSLLRTSGHL